jgi:hypothetical protein
VLSSGLSGFSGQRQDGAGAGLRRGQRVAPEPFAFGSRQSGEDLVGYQAVLGELPRRHEQEQRGQAGEVRGGSLTAATQRQLADRSAADPEESSAGLRER